MVSGLTCSGSGLRDRRADQPPAIMIILLPCNEAHFHCQPLALSLHLSLSLSLLGFLCDHTACDAPLPWLGIHHHDSYSSLRCALCANLPCKLTVAIECEFTKLDNFPVTIESGLETGSGSGLAWS